jgi:four helix bundle protein
MKNEKVVAPAESPGYEKHGSDIRERAFQFGVRVVKVCDHLDERPGSGRTLARQLLRAATSIGANLEEAHGAYSRTDFAFRVSIALKEARETRYWLRLIVAAEIVSQSRIRELQQESDEIARILGAIVASTRQNP